MKETKSLKKLLLARNLRKFVLHEENKVLFEKN